MPTTTHLVILNQSKSPVRETPTCPRKRILAPSCQYAKKKGCSRAERDEQKSPVPQKIDISAVMIPAHQWKRNCIFLCRSFVSNNVDVCFADEQQSKEGSDRLSPAGSDDPVVRGTNPDLGDQEDDSDDCLTLSSDDDEDEEEEEEDVESDEDGL